MKISFDTTVEQDAAMQRSLDKAISEGLPPVSLEDYLNSRLQSCLNAHVEQWANVDAAPVLDSFQKNYPKLATKDQQDVLAILAKVDAIEAKP